MFANKTKFICMCIVFYWEIYIIMQQGQFKNLRSRMTIRLFGHLLRWTNFLFHFSVERVINDHTARSAAHTNRSHYLRHLREWWCESVWKGQRSVKMKWGKKKLQRGFRESGWLDEHYIHYTTFSLDCSSTHGMSSKGIDWYSHR